MKLLAYEKFGSIMELAWPRISLYENVEVLKDGVAESTTFCGWNPSIGSELICVEGKCMNCTEAPWSPGLDLYSSRCKGQLGRPDDWEWDQLRKQEMENIIDKLEELEIYPAESISVEDASMWTEKFQRNSVLGKLEDCDAPPELTLSQKFLMRKWIKWDDEESTWGNHQEELKWLIGEDWSRDRPMCEDGLVCGPEGICVACGLTTFWNDVLERICNELGEKNYYVEKDVFVRSTRKPNSSELLSTTVMDPMALLSINGAGSTILLSCGLGMVVVLLVIGSGF